MSVSSDLSQQIVNQAWSRAESLLADLDTRLDRAETASGGSIGAIPPANITPLAAIVEPTVDIPTSAATNIDLFTAKRTEVINGLTTLFTSYISAYFPSDNAVFSKAEQVMQDMLNGTDSALETALWQRDQDRILLDAQRAEDEAAAFWAARRFPLPPGALASAVSRVQFKAQEEIAKSSREALIQAREQVKFAVEASIKTRSLALGSACEYIKALVGNSDNIFAVSSNAQSNLISAVAAFYNARTNAKDTVFKSTVPGATLDHDTAKIFVEATKDLMKKRVDTSVAAAQTVGSAASAMLNNLHTSIGVQGKEDL